MPTFPRTPRNLPAPGRRQAVRAVLALALVLPGSACAPGRPAPLGPVPNPDARAERVRAGTRPGEGARIEFRWELNEQGSRVSGIGIARVEAPYRARLDLFLENGEGVVTAALVDDDLRLPHGAPDDVLPPLELMWGTLGVFRPVAGARLNGGESLDNGSERLRYAAEEGREIHYEVSGDAVRGLELLQGTTVVQWVRLTPDPEGPWPLAATYRNLQDYRELKIERTRVVPTESFDPSIWDPRGQ